MQNVTALKQNKSGVQNAIAYLQSEASESQAVSYYQKDGSNNYAFWAGKLAEALNLKGKPVNAHDMTKLAEGFAPDDGRKLCENAGEKPKLEIKKDRKGNVVLDENGNQIELLKGGHRIGYDITMSAPKDVSIALVMADEKEKALIVKAHNDACNEAMKYYESKVETRRGKGGKNVIGVSGLIYSGHTHFANRNLEAQLHTHHLVYGVAQGEDGKWGTYDAFEIYNHARTADEIYKAHLYSNMQSLGYKLERFNELDDTQQETGKVITRIAGIDADVLENASSRRKEILAYQKEHGVSAQAACMATRQNKDEPPLEEMFQLWKDWLESQDGDFIRNTNDLKKIEQSELLAAKTHDQIIERLHENDSVFTHRDAVREIFHENCGLMDAKEIGTAVSQFLQEEGLVEVGAKRLAKGDQGETWAKRFTESRYAAQWMADKELDVLHGAQRRVQEDHHEIPSYQVAQCIRRFQKEAGFQISDEQRLIVNHVTSNQGMVLVEGLAGTGKTTITKITNAAFQGQGKRMFGIAVSNAAAKKLEEESGMECSSVAQLLADVDRGKVQFHRDDVVVLDECGMVSTADLLEIMALTEKAGAKLVLQGDAEQLQPIGAGSGMQLVRDVIGSEKLTEIRRQKAQEDLDIAKAFYVNNGHERLEIGTRSHRETLEKGVGIVGMLEARGAIDEYEKKSQSIAALIKDFMASKEPPSDKIILAHARAEVRAINKGIREELRKLGQLGPKDVVVKTLQNGKFEDREIVKGDRIRFNVKNRNLGVINGTEAVIEKLSRSRNDDSLNIHVRTADGKHFHFNEKFYNTFDHAYAMTVHKSQGQGAKEVFHLGNIGMTDNASALVAFTRLTSGKYRLYVTSDEKERLHTRVALERLKENVFETGLCAPADGRQDAMQRLRLHAMKLRKERKETEKQSLIAERPMPSQSFRFH
ncbi:MobF family relaxase [Stenotrophomonas maltophilia]|uniref:MobF family relaxase n=2 Tax=Stenotrophomonas maltophilia TaxID=40324 RepID=UPI000D68130A|nr:MobF family relaxase [Stenotrophomonas maltophilia]MBH1417669.1 relaxase domain-containing protein [Stenotrophomonas maltophilia]MBH1813572.1 relaxase domain-containing protein [Stenotrophomonas maltophilia]MBH1822639.1 relaxase domain-containing protein [Stenotrophomonas maltophilia]MDZ5805088.1 MobF family relaxase [Stenotrophomonas maltophilia]PWI04169.1 conjugal transfer protein TraA [Stenotrophomonas maltophilia]